MDTSIPHDFPAPLLHALLSINARRTIIHANLRALCKYQAPVRRTALPPNRTVRGARRDA